MTNVPAARVSDAAVLQRIAHVFRQAGYAGASLSALSVATGLERASLYHRFPGGKEDMALAVIRSANEWFAEHVFGPLLGPETAGKRVELVARNLSRYYGEGSLWCILDTLSIGAPAAVSTALQATTQAWIAAFTGFVTLNGAPPDEAARRATQAVAGIEGSLVLARIQQDPGAFKQTLAQLPKLLLP